jgi:hypothetical protein
MRIYGRSFKEIFALLHWTQKIIVVIGSAFIVFVVCYLTWLGTRSAIDAATAKKAQVLSISGTGPGKAVSGVLDPSLAVAGSTSFLAFTGVSVAAGKAPGMDIYIAQGSHDCAKMSLNETPVLSGKDDEIMAPDGETPLAKGRWRVETPTLVHDPADAKAPWKIFAYRYFWANDPTRAVPFARLFNSIVMTTATTPGPGGWTRETWALSASADVPPFPYNNLARQQITSLSPELADGYFFSRPSVVIVNDVYFMTLSAFIKGKDTPDRIILLASPDRGQTWNYAGTPLNAAQVKKLGFSNLQGGTLIKDGSRVLLAAVLGDDKVAGQGTFLFAFDSLTRGQLLADTTTGAPAVIKHVPLSSAAFSAIGGGFAAYAPECKGGLTTAEFSQLRGDYFIFETFESPPK